MKTKIFVLLALALVGCSKGSKLEEQGPGGNGNGNGNGGETGLKTVAYVKSLYQGAPRTISDDIYIEGWVVSSDEFGNFYKTLVIQDETGGIELKLDMNDIFLDYWVDSKYKVNCNSLTIGMYGGSVQLGAASSDPQYHTDYIANNKIASVISEIAGGATEVVPEALTLAQICAPGADMSKHINCYVSISGVQFADGGQATWSEEEADTNRELVDVNGNKINVRTSRYADFAENLLPAGSGTIKGILGYFNGEYQLKVSNPVAVVMEGDRF